jgi:hypothetical protein
VVDLVRQALAHEASSNDPDTDGLSLQCARLKGIVDENHVFSPPAGDLPNAKKRRPSPFRLNDLSVTETHLLLQFRLELVKQREFLIFLRDDRHSHGPV